MNFLGLDSSNRYRPVQCPCIGYRNLVTWSICWRYLICATRWQFSQSNYHFTYCSQARSQQGLYNCLVVGLFTSSEVNAVQTNISVYQIHCSLLEADTTVASYSNRYNDFTYKCTDILICSWILTGLFDKMLHTSLQT